MKKYILLILTIVILSACGKPKENMPAVTKTSVKLDIVKKELLNEVIIGNGSFETVKDAEHRVIEADVTKVNYKNGDFVKAGDVVVVLENKTITADYENAKASLMKAEAEYEASKKFTEASYVNQYESAKADMESAKEAWDKALRGNNQENITIGKLDVIKAQNSFEQASFNYEKYKKIYDENLISESSYLGYKTTYEQAKASLESSQKSLDLLIKGSDLEDIKTYEAKYNKAKSEYSLSKKNIDEKKWLTDLKIYEASYLSAKTNYFLAEKEYNDLTVKAKIDGLVNGLNIKPFEKTSSTEVLFHVIDNSQMEINIGLHVADVSKINLDSKADIYIEELDKTIAAKIYEISPAADETTKKFMVKIIIDNKDNTLKEGLYGKVIIHGDSREMLVVPKEAVIIKNLYKYVFIAENGKAKRIKIELGSTTESFQEIITENVNQGDKIVIDGQYLLQDNASIEEVNS